MSTPIPLPHGDQTSERRQTPVCTSPILEEVLAFPNLPSLPAVAARILELTRDPDVDLREIAGVVQNDQALTVKILRTVNSTYYGLAHPCRTISRAIGYLGLSTVKSLVLGFSLVDLSKDCHPDFDLVEYWRRNLSSAAIARRIATLTAACDPEEAFVAALMQDIGMLAMQTALGPRYMQLLSRTNGNHRLLPQWESASLGFTHAEAGARLGQGWNLPAQLLEPILNHHLDITPGDGDVNAIVGTVALSYQVANLVSSPGRPSALVTITDMAHNLLDMSVKDLRTVIQSTAQDTQDLSSLLEVTVGNAAEVEQLLAKADEALEKHLKGMRHKADPASCSGARIVRESLADSLTGVSNRVRFDHDVAHHFEQTQAARGNLGLIILGADNLDALREAFGDAAGDVALRSMARALTKEIGPTGVVFRFGDNAFAVLMCGASQIVTAKAAERLRAVIERHRLIVRRDPASDAAENARMTVSVGVAVLEPGVANRLQHHELLVNLAEQALEAAGRAGRNCVRIFVPTETAA